LGRPRARAEQPDAWAGLEAPRGRPRASDPPEARRAPRAWPACCCTCCGCRPTRSPARTIAHFAAAAVLSHQELRGGACWSNEEMDEQRALVLRATGCHDCRRVGPEAPAAASERLAHSFICEQMLDATQNQRPIPDRDALVVKAAEFLFCRSFSCIREVEMAMARETAGV
ncbi:unnamed protein product, partial [Prorocentrum cordatum]